jgi:uncharacterized damage-inducible protein DinB
MTEKDLLVLQLEQAFDKRSWHGTNLLGSVRGLPHRDASWRPGEGRHNIWEIVVHAAYWKYTVYRQLTGEARGSFALKGSNWFARTAGDSEELFKADVSMLKQYHRKLLEAVLTFPAASYGKLASGKKNTYRDLVVGIAAHDLYHAGQIQLLKRLKTK